MFNKFNKPSMAFYNATKRSFGVNEKAIKMRMKSVENIEKITKAMKMVATSKMKADINRLTNGQHFGFQSINVLYENDNNLS